MDIQLSIATPESVADWLPLFTAYLDFYRVSQPPEACREYLSERLRRRQAVAFLARRGDTPLGFALMYTGFSSLSLQPCWVLHDLYVASASRQEGVGKMLILRCQQYARDQGGGEIMLQTAHDNLNAQRLYESLGFAMDRDFRVYYWSCRHS
ncbi:GNAT family N-acetyltransferase [Chromobacterium violaceum]|uniref:GNAT family N-acetyltransferase n=1 Tax=Chromobacterium violaceum TaxID=536 RepID=UPI001E4DB9BB|nr:GNAT family N-acetyltransferase [Chromobacterium violaceum]MCD0494387.1 GNAT family N-acetyltransferase [Chromobacterium violaceum]